MGRPTDLSQEERSDLMRRGYRPIEIWVPDLDSETLRTQLQQEAQRIAEADAKEGIMDWIEAIGPTDWDKP